MRKGTPDLMADRQGRSGLRVCRLRHGHVTHGFPRDPAATSLPAGRKDERGRPGTFVPASDEPHDRPTRGSRRQLDVTCLPCRVARNGRAVPVRARLSDTAEGITLLLDLRKHYTQHDRSGLRRPNGGTSPILPRVAPDSRDSIGLAPGEAQCRGAIVHLRGRSSARSTLPLEERNGDAAVELVAQLVEAIRARPVLGVLGEAASDDTTDRAGLRAGRTNARTYGNRASRPSEQALQSIADRRRGGAAGTAPAALIAPLAGIDFLRLVGARVGAAASPSGRVSGPGSGSRGASRR